MTTETNTNPVEDTQAAENALAVESVESTAAEDAARAAAEAGTTPETATETPKEPEGDKPEDNAKDEPEQELDKEKWGTTGDETGDSVLSLLQNSGVDPDVAKSLLYDAVVAGDPTQIDRDALVEKVGKTNANLIMAGVENYVSRQKAEIAAVETEVHTVAGGKSNWTKVAEWSRSNVPQAERTELAAMIDKGGAQARFAAAELINRYNTDEKNTSINTTTRVVGDGKSPDTGRAINRRTYAEELDKAHRNKANPAVIKEIQAARERGRKRGL